MLINELLLIKELKSIKTFFDNFIQLKIRLKFKKRINNYEIINNFQ